MKAESEAPGWSRRLLAIGIAGALGLLAPPAASAAVDFRTPQGTAYCRVSGSALSCWTPDDGFTARMGRRTLPSTRYAAGNEGATPAARRVLRFGRTWRSGAFRCTSRRSGLTCRNAGGHGWWLGRPFGYRIF